MIVVYLIFLLILSVYSYSLTDPNLTLVNSNLWTDFRNTVVYFGYYQRFWSWFLYLSLIAILFLFYLYFYKRSKELNPLKLALIIGGVLILSYPFLSHDFFNYLFDAKILTFYFKNPYFYKALDFPNDPWVRFMHWTHRTYPYGPVFLLITIVPSLLSLGKFFLSFLFFKVTWFIFYMLTVYLLNKQNRSWAVLFSVHPLIIVEGLVNNHNDLIGASLAIAGSYCLLKNKKILGRLFLVLSAGIKYITFPLIFLTGKSKNKLNIILFLLILGIIGYLTFFAEIQPWYFLALFAFIPYMEKLILQMNIFFLGLLLSYYPYIYLGGWDSLEKMQLKHIIILVFLFLNLVYWLWLSLTKHEKFRNTLLKI